MGTKRRQKIMSEKQATTIKILDREYQIACTAEEKVELAAAAEYLDEQMRALRNSGSIVGAEKIAVITALNIANDLLRLRRTQDSLQQDVGSRVHALRERLEAAADTLTD